MAKSKSKSSRRATPKSKGLAGLASPSDAIERIASTLERLAPPRAALPDLGTADAFVWHPDGRLVPVPHVNRVEMSLLKGIDRVRDVLVENTERFARGLPANNALLWGARGMGKSSLVKAAHAGANADLARNTKSAPLKLIEIHREDIDGLPTLMALTRGSPHRFIVFCDDLSFEEGESGYKALKVALDGSVAAQSDNVLIYATSNRRHLLPEYMSDNETYKHMPDGEIHPGEVVEEKISLSERFGLWVSFYPFKQDDYLSIVAHWLRHFGCDDAGIEAARGDALVWALERGSRSGRVAWQFARDWSGRRAPA